jgi:hypothetical protein
VILGSQRLRVIMVLPLLSYLFSILFAQGILFAGGGISYWNWALFLGVAIVAVTRTRVLRRTGEWIEILSLRRRKILAKDYLLHLETAVSGRFSSVQWQFACEKNPERSLHMGSLFLSPRRGMEVARSVLDLRISFETEAILNAAQRVGGVTPRWQKVALGSLIAIAIALIAVSSIDRKGQMVIQCADDQDVRLSGGYGSVSGSRMVDVRPGDYDVDLWIPQRSCWARKRVTIVAGKAVSIRCQDLAGAYDCIAGDAPRIYGVRAKRSASVNTR